MKSSGQTYRIPSAEAWAEWTLPLGLGVTAAAIVLFAATMIKRDTTTIMLLGLMFGAPGAVIVFRNPHCFNLQALALPSVALWSYATLIAIPSVFVFLEETDRSRYSYLAATLSVLFTFPLGVWFTEFLSTARQRSLQTASGPDWARLRRWWDIAFLFGIGVVLLHVYQVGLVPLNEVLSLRGDWLATAELREEAGHLLPGVINRYLFFWNRIFIMPGLTVLALGAYRAQKNRTWLIRLLAASLVALFHGTFTLEKSFGMILFLAVGAFLYLDGRSRIKLRYLISAILGALVFPLFIFWWIIPEGGEWTEVAVSLGRRVLSVPAQVTFLYFELVPKQMAFFHGATSHIMAFLTRQRFFDLTNYLFLQEFSQNIETGTANACFVGAAWANFGWFGVLVEGFLAGVTVAILYRLIRDREDIFSRAFHTLLIVPLMLGLTNVPIETIFLSYGVVPALVAWMLLTRFVLQRNQSPLGVG